MLKSKTNIYPWKCFCCEGIFESNQNAGIIWVTPLPEANVMHCCHKCEPQTSIEEITCGGCHMTFTAVYHKGHDNVICTCSHVNYLKYDNGDDDEDECGGGCAGCDGCN